MINSILEELKSYLEMISLYGFGTMRKENIEQLEGIMLEVEKYDMPHLCMRLKRLRDLMNANTFPTEEITKNLTDEYFRVCGLVLIMWENK